MTQDAWKSIYQLEIINIQGTYWWQRLGVQEHRFELVLLVSKMHHAVGSETGQRDTRYMEDMKLNKSEFII